MGKNIKVIERSAFNNCIHLQEVRLPDGLIEIGERAFMNTGLKDIYIPDSVGHIYEDAFRGCKDLTIHCNQGSYAEAFAAEQNIQISYE